MRLQFLGANQQVTGSCYCLSVNGAKIMIDCGLTQEREYQYRNWQACPVPVEKINYLILTHVHIDHSGLIPKLVRNGFRGRIYATKPTVDLAHVVLHDAAKIQMEDARYKKRRHQKEGRSGKHPETPLYDVQDAEKALALCMGCDYDRPLQLGENINVCFRDAGHILGSAMLEFRIKEQEKPERVLIFSGDIGQRGKPLIGDPAEFTEADYVVMESTYGDRDHDRSGDIEGQLARVINRTIGRGGNVVIPTFAIERAQELMYYLGRLIYSREIPDTRIYLDSPMAVDITEIFRHNHEYLDRESQQLILSHQPPLRYPGLRLVQSVAESKAINLEERPCIIMSPAGMCNAGRIKHHLRCNIGRPESTVLFVGYQARGTLGRQILDGDRDVRIHGQMRRVRASIEHIQGLSAHADQSGLIHWLRQLNAAPRQIFLTHGEKAAATQLSQRIQQNLGWPVTIPSYLDVVELT